MLTMWIIVLGFQLKNPIKQQNSTIREGKISKPDFRKDNIRIEPIGYLYYISRLLKFFPLMFSSMA